MQPHKQKHTNNNINNNNTNNKHAHDSNTKSPLSLSLSPHPLQQQSNQIISQRELEERIKKLTLRLSRENICKEHKLISNMNLKLEIKLSEILKLEEFRSLSIDDSVYVVSRINCLEPVTNDLEVQQSTLPLMHVSTTKTTTNNIESTTSMKNQSNHQNHKHQHYQEKEKYETKTLVNNNNNNNNINNNPSLNYNYNPNQLYKLKYPNSEKTIILAGINRHWIENSIKEFNNINNESINQRSSSYKKHPTHHYQHISCQISGFNEFWIAVEADTVQNAQIFKKFIRMRKKSFEEKKDFSFKEDKRRVRIVMQNEDFYTLLVDAMTEKKNSEFIKRLVNPNSGMFPTMCLRDTRRMSAFPNEEYQLGLKKTNKILYFPIIVNRPESKEGDDHFLLEEVYSEDRSRVSEFFDLSNSMDDLVQKADQGTQAESLGIGTNDEEIGGQEMDMNKYESGEGEITSEMVSMNHKNKVHEEKSWESLSGFEKEGEDSVVDGDDKEGSIKDEIVVENEQMRDDNKNNKSNFNIKGKNHEELAERTNAKNDNNTKIVNNSREESEPESDHEVIAYGFIGKHEEEKIDLVKEKEINIESGLVQEISNPERKEDNTISLSKKSNTFEETEIEITNPPENKQNNSYNSSSLTLNDLREPQLPSKLLTFYFSTHVQTQSQSLSYTKMKRLEQEYMKKSASRIRLTPGIPEEFRQVSEKERNRDLFFVNIFKSMERRSQKKEYISEFF